MIFRTIILKTSGMGFVKKLVTGSKMFRPLVRRFIAGETLQEAMASAEQLAASGFFVTLDLLGENVASLEDANVEKAGYLDAAKMIGQSKHRDSINISIKLTALGLDQSDEAAEANYRELLAAAAESSMFVRADMEGSPYTERTISMVERVFADCKNTGTVLQAMLIRTEQDVDRLIRLGCRVRMVKGAYLEPAEIAHQDKAVVDQKYVEYAKKLMELGNYPAIASHDEKIIDELKAFAKEKGIPNDRFEWQMLFGIRRDLQESLLKEGYRVRVYVPYGSKWYPYFSRRLAERPANLFFIMRAALGK